MTAAQLPELKAPTCVSEIFPVTIAQPNLICFRLTPHLDEANQRQLENRLSYHLSRQFPDVTVIGHQGSFYALAKPNAAMPNAGEWRMALEQVRTEVKDLSDRSWGIQWVHHAEASPTIIAQLAHHVLQTDCRFTKMPVLVPGQASQQVMVNREAEFWSETIELNGELTPAIALTVSSSILFKGNLAEFFENHPLRQNSSKVLMDLHVQEIEKGGHGIVVEIAGTIGEKRKELEEQATGSTSKQALKDAPDAQPIVGVRFGRNPKVYEYAMAALRPHITGDTDDRFGVKYGQLLRLTKIKLVDRTQLIQSYKTEAAQALAGYGFQLGNSINSRDYSDLFWYPAKPIPETALLFGKGFVGQQRQILNGLKVRNGGVYRRNLALDDPIQIAVLKLCNLSVNRFLSGTKYCLKQFGFESDIVHRQALTVESNSTLARAELEKALNEVIALSPDIVLLFLPEDDRAADKRDGGSLYQFAYSHLLRQRIATQFIYDDTLTQVQSGQILNQVVPGILAKLGNLPFVLAEPLEIADYFIGLDVSRSPKAKLAGSLNACASVRLYGKQGEFVRYRLEDAMLEGEEIPQRLLERLLPASEMAGKTILIYRDGRFCGQEVAHLLEWAAAINAKFILVECIKSGIPRLYHSNQKLLAPPNVGLALRMSPREAIAITTDVSPGVGLARPLRLRVHTESHPAAIADVVETTLKLTLLHHGALKTPRLPMPLYGADRMAYLKLNGIYPNVLEGDRQFWL